MCSKCGKHYNFAANIWSVRVNGTYEEIKELFTSKEKDITN